MKQKILYLGMDDDIITVLKLFPHFDKLFVIDYNMYKTKHDDLFNYIITILTTGKITHRHSSKIINIGIKCDIIKNVRTNDGTRWILKFMMGGKIRKIVRYEQDFYNIWPKSVKNINHIIGIGAMHWDCLRYDRARCDIPTPPKNVQTHVLRNMFIERTILPFTLIVYEFLHDYVDDIILLTNTGRGEDHYTRLVDDDEYNDRIVTYVISLARITITKFPRRWYYKYRTKY